MKALPVIHASRFGSSTKAMALELLGYSPDPIDDKLQKIFDEGNKHEITALNYLRDNHGLDFRQDFEAKDQYMKCKFKFKNGVSFYISASTDSQFNKPFTMLKCSYHHEDVLFPADSFGEVKNMSDSNFNKMRPKRGMTGEERIAFQFPKYYAQVQVYLMVHKKLGLPWEKALFIVRRKSDGVVMTYPIYANEEFWKGLKKKGKVVTEHYNNGTIPNCECTSKDKRWCHWTTSCLSIDRVEAKNKLNTGDDKMDGREFDEGQELILPSYIINASGTTFKKKNMQDLVDRAPAFEDLKLFLDRDPDNKYDPNAIKVMIKHTRKRKINGVYKKRSKSFDLGFIPKSFTAHVSTLMDDDNYFIELHKCGFKNDKPYVTILIRCSL